MVVALNFQVFALIYLISTSELIFAVETWQVEGYCQFGKYPGFRSQSNPDLAPGFPHLGEEPFLNFLPSGKID